MKVLLTLLFVLTATFAQAQSIIKSLERNSAGTGKGDDSSRSLSIEASDRRGTSCNGRTESVEGSRIQNTGVCR